MTKSPVTSLDVTCPKCGGDEFEIRLLKDEGVGAAICAACSRAYLLLDSADYWFDTIQQGYPRPARCSCKSETFRLCFDYEYREDGDVRTIDLWSACAACGRSRRQMRIDIDYSPTAKLVRRPLTYCRNPKILYDLRELSLYATRADIARTVHYLADDAGCTLTGWLRAGGEWARQSLDAAAAERAILADRYQMIYAGRQPLEVPDDAVSTARKESRFWKRHEIVRIDSPISMMWGSRTGRLYYIQFSNEYVERCRAVPKSADFRGLTAALVEWLREEFVAWRGPDCFDNPREHARLFGRRYRDRP